MILYGYLSIISAIAILLVLTEKVFNRFLKKEFCRKILHIGTFSVFPLAEHFFGSGSFHFVIICLVFTLMTAIMHFLKLFRTVDSREKRYPGIFYYALSLLILSLFSYFFKDMSIFFGVGFIALSFGDGLATLIGGSVKSPKIYGDKTVVGFISCFVFTLVPLFIFNEIKGGFLQIEHVFLLALLSSVVELVDFGLDNLLIPVSLFFMGNLLCVSSDATVALLIAEGVFLLAFFTGIIKYYGALLASCIGFLFYFFGGASGILFVVGCYAVMISASILGKILKNDLSSVVKKTKGKDFVEIFVNGIWSIIGIVLFGITKNEAFYIISLISMCAGFVDSLASDIGTLSKKPPYDIFHRKHVEKGVSGGVSLLGSVSSLVGAVVFATVITLMCQIPTYMIGVITFIAYFGCFTDTFLGSFVQVKYRCVSCNKATEKEIHCNKPSEIASGIPFINNDTVNFLSGAVVFAMSFSIFIFI